MPEAPVETAGALKIEAAPPTPADELGPHTKIHATKGFAALQLREVWQFRDLLWTLAHRDIKVRYRQTALGVVWVILQPLLASGIFSFVFGLLAGLKSDNNGPYFVFAFAGLMGWNLFSGTLNRVANCLVANGNLISKVYFPRLILPLSSLPAVLVDFVVGLAMQVVLMAIFGVWSGWGILLLPVWMAILMAAATGMGLWLAALMVKYRDVGYVLPLALQILMYAVPVVYSISKVPAWLKPYYYLNPLAGVVVAFRWSLLGGPAPETWPVAWSAAGSAIALFAGAVLFKRMERKFADVI